jgi:hypothetical protein
VREGDDEARHEPESMSEISHAVLSRDEALQAIASDGQSRNDANDVLLIGRPGRIGRGSDEERRCDHLEVDEKARRLMVGSNGE